MAIGERIHFLRNLRGMTQKYLGTLVGFPEKTADVRMAQYESGTRTPKADLTNKLAQALDVSPKALDLPDIDSYIGLMHTLFALEDMYGLKIGEIDGEVCLRLDKSRGSDFRNLFDMRRRAEHEADHQQAQAAKLEAGEITKEEYDQWRYRYPEFDNKPGWVKVTPSQEFSDMLVESLKETE